MSSIVPPATNNVDRRQRKASTDAPWQHHVVVIGAAALIAVALCAVALNGFNAVARCEVDSYNLLRQNRSAISEIALINGCGF